MPRCARLLALRDGEGGYVPSDALLSSEMMPWVSVLVLLAVAAAQPLARFLSAVSSLLLGEESTAFGWLTAPNLIR